MTEEPPTEDQFKSILEYMGGASNVGKLFPGVKTELEALKKLKSDPNSFVRPVVRFSLGINRNTKWKLTSHRLLIGTTAVP